MTLCILDDRIKNVSGAVFGQLCFSIFCALFGAIYEVFSHEVYSYFMIYAFVIPMIFGVLLPILIIRSGAKIPDERSVSLWNMAVVTCTVGSVFKGVIDIYGTTNRFTVIYPVAALVLAVSAAGHYFFGKDKSSDTGTETRTA